MEIRTPDVQLNLSRDGIASGDGFADAGMETVLLPSNQPFSASRQLASAHATQHARRRLWNAGAIAMAEAAALAVALLAAGLLRQWVTGGSESVIGYAWAVIPVYTAGAWIASLLPGWGLGAVEELRRVVLVLGASLAVTGVALWLGNTNLPGETPSSRLTLGLASLLAVGIVPASRWWVKATLTRRDQWGVSAVVYGAGVMGARIVRQLQEERGIGYTPLAVFSDDPEDWGGYLDTIPILGDTSRVVPEASVAFLALPEAERSRQIDVLEGPLSCYRTVVVVPDLFEAPSLWVTPRDFAGVLGLELSSTLTRRLPRLVKRVVDLAAVVGTALFWAPVVGLLALWVWLGDRASPFYGQKRIGEDGKTFTAWKLRTMVPDADVVLQKALDDDPELRAEWEQFFKLESDPRITTAGRLLRRTSLDELPQLINVLKGEMSLVGPRPLPAYHHGELAERVRILRERVKPGITGLWQVSGRSDSGNAGMERWDPYYVRNWSLWLDAVILVRTVRVVVRGSGAY
ncbi:MAG: exopolysaccharide biosynthesis polyprenyl glycosylphosphotransferase [Bacteroidota bacterium]